MGKWRRWLKIDSGATKQRTILFCRTQEFYPAQPSPSIKNSLSQHFLTIWLHSRWTNVHFMGKWRLRLKIDLGATKQRAVLFNLTQEFYPAQPSSSIKKSFSQHFFTILFHSKGKNVHFMCKWREGIKIELRATKQRQHSLTSHKNFTQRNPPLQEKIRYVSIFSQFCFIPGEQMSTLWGNGEYGLKSTLGQQSSGQNSLTTLKIFSQPNHPLQ